MPTIDFKAQLYTSTDTPLNKPEVLLSLPKSASAQLPSRGMTLIKGVINGRDFQAVVEPDGKGSHWFRVDKDLQSITKIKPGDTAELSIEPSKDWPEPKIPAEISKVLSADKEATAIWEDITPMARWDWIRWAGAVKQADTRQKRIQSLPSRLKAGKRRPCCFDRNVCTLTDA
jgi:hypothetical protein